MTLENVPDKDLVVKRTIELLGGQRMALETLAQEYATIQKLWDQDLLTIGRILRSHLFVEHFLEFSRFASYSLGKPTATSAAFARAFQEVDAIASG